MIILKSPEEVARMRQAGRIVAAAVERLMEVVEPGMTTEDLDRIAADVIAAHGALPSFKGYRGFPATICTSLNDEVVHGIPSPKRKVIPGDVLKLDVGCIWQGWHADAAVLISYVIGRWQLFAKTGFKRVPQESWDLQRKFLFG